MSLEDYLAFDRGTDERWEYVDGEAFLVTSGSPEHNVVNDLEDRHAIDNPTVLVEVLSPSTSDYDRGGKFVHYRTLESLREYVIVSLAPRLVEAHRRLEQGKWLMIEAEAGEIELASIDVRIAWEDLFRDLERL